MLIYLAGGAGLLLLAALLVHCLQARSQRRSLAGQLREIRERPFDNVLLRLDRGDRSFREVVREMNALLEAQRSETRALEAQRRSLRAQITAISHDLRTPLTSIRGYVELAGETGDAAKRRAYMDVIRRRAEVLNSLIGDFYELARLEDPHHRLHCELLRPDLLLEDSLLAFYDDFEARGLRLEPEIRSDARVYAARSELTRVYGNLIQNILKYGKDEVRIWHGRRAGRLQSRFSNALFPGAAVDVERVFERFYTGDASRSDRSTGLGLYTVRLLLEKMGHEVRAELSRGRFVLTITYGREGPAGSGAGEAGDAAGAAAGPAPTCAKM